MNLNRVSISCLEHSLLSLTVPKSNWPSLCHIGHSGKLNRCHITHYCSFSILISQHHQPLLPAPPLRVTPTCLSIPLATFFLFSQHSHLTPSDNVSQMLWLLEKSLPLHPNQDGLSFLCHTLLLNLLIFTFSVSPSKASQCEVVCWPESIPLCFHLTRTQDKRLSYRSAQEKPLLEVYLPLLSPGRQ